MTWQTHSPSGLAYSGVKIRRLSCALAKLSKRCSSTSSSTTTGSISRSEHSPPLLPALLLLLLLLVLQRFLRQAAENRPLPKLKALSPSPSNLGRPRKPPPDRSPQRSMTPFPSLRALLQDQVVDAAPSGWADHPTRL